MDATFLLRLYANIRLAALAAEDTPRTQASQLMALVRRARHTRFGRDHDFGSIRSVADYQARVPLRRYADFWDRYWSGSYPLLDGVTWPGRIPYFALTSGTSSGSSKFVPVSADMVRSNRRAGLDIVVHHLAGRPGGRVLGGKTLMLGGSTNLEMLAEDVWRGDLSGIASREVPRWARPWTFPPAERALDADWERKIDRLARSAVTEDIRALAGPPNWMLLFLDRLGAPPREIWPRLELFIHGGTGFAPYRRRFATLLGDAATREVYPASEGFVAMADRQPGQGMRLLADNGLFFEFVPLADLDSPAPTRHWVADAQPGIDYAIVLTSCAGLWSYVLGDVVRLVDRKPPRLLVTGRTGWMLNMFGEHLSGEQIESSVVAAAGPHAVTDYAAGALFPEAGARGRHSFVVEFADPPPADFAMRLDAELRRASLDYAERRAADVGLEAPTVVVVPPGFFAEWMRRRGRLGGQNKVPRVIADEATMRDLLMMARA